MRKEGEKFNFRVVIEPRSLGDFGSIRVSASFFYGNTDSERKRWGRDMQDRCDEIAKDVKRHVDQVGSVSVDFDQEYVCEYCGAEWTEGKNSYNGGCCDKDCEEEDKRLADKAVNP
jgi:hypothetical protein